MGIELVLIFLARTVDMTLSTVRNVLTVRGYKYLAPVIAFFEIIIWALAASKVLAGIAENPFRLLAYALGFSTGILLGSLLEEKLAFGNVEIQAIVKKENSEKIITKLKEEGHGVTAISTCNELVVIITIYAKRKLHKHVIELIKGIQEDSVITMTDLKSVQNGYIRGMAK